jgi:hypothetical protein
MAVAGFGSLSGHDADAVVLTDLTPFLVAGGGVDLEEVVFDATRDWNQQQPCGRAGCPELVGRPRGRNTKLPAAAVNASPPRRTVSSPSSTYRHSSSRSCTCIGGPAPMLVSKTLGRAVAEASRAVRKLVSSSQE